MDEECFRAQPRYLTLMQLEPDDCRFPFGDGPITFCGHPKTPGSSYCREHHLLCEVPTARQLKRKLVAA